MNKEFIWGVATSAYQIEGAVKEDGRGDTIWDVFSHTPGKTAFNHNGDIACNSYRLFEQDIDLISGLNAKAYRFSCAWSRIFPEGEGKINQKGIDYYLKLTDILIDKGIEPFVTLYHWDLPYELYKKGGFLNRDIAKKFGDYAELIVQKLGDRVKNYITFNEPQCIIGAGHQTGFHAPGLKLNRQELAICAHNLLLAHGEAVTAIRANSKAKIGFVSCDNAFCPETNTSEDIEAARLATFDTSRFVNGLSLYNDAIFLGDYPEDFYKKFEDIDKSYIKGGDMELISQKIDYCCQNNYSCNRVKADKEKGYEILEREAGFPVNSLNMPIEAKGLYWIMKFLAQRYKKPMFVTENGLCCNDVISLDGKVHDTYRIDYLNRHLIEVKKLINEGIDIKGYFAWSLMDNFEWSFGYGQRFGLVYLDYKTLRRIPKDSYYWYKQIIELNGESL